MKYLVVAYWHDSRFKNKPGGLIRMFELADNLLDMGHDVAMVLPKLGFPKAQTRARVIEIPFLDIPILRPLCFHVLSTLYLLSANPGRIDCLYVRQMNSFLPFLVSRMFGIFSYFELPNDPYRGYSLESPGKRLIIEVIDRLCVTLADRIVVLSLWSKKRLHAMGDVPLAKILVFPSGTDTELFTPRDPAACRRELNLDPSYYYVGFIGSFLEYQGIDTLIDVAPSILKKIPTTRFLLVGDGPMRKSWENRARKQGVRDYFLFIGHVPYRQVPAYLGAMDVCVAPHHADTNQASPVKLFDYMAAGRPIVASDIEVVREIIGDSRCAVLFNPEDDKHLGFCITSILQNPVWAKDLGEKGRSFCVSNYDRKMVTRKLFTAGGSDDQKG